MTEGLNCIFDVLLWTLCVKCKGSLEQLWHFSDASTMSDLILPLYLFYIFWRPFI